MNEINITDNLSGVQKEIASWMTPKTAIEINTVTARAVGVKAESVVSDYPPPSRKPLPFFYTRTRKDGTTYRSKFKSAKQQGFVMVLAAQGKIPYRRTGTLGRSITSRVRSVTPSDASVSIGSNKAYAPYVIDREKQSHYHKGAWTPLQTDVERNMSSIADTAQRVHSAEIARRFSI